MKKNFNLDELDDFLSESAEQHRMYPSDKVWRNIDQELHGSKRWPALTFCTVLTVAIITAGLLLIHPDKNLFTVTLPVPQTTQAAASEKTTSTGASTTTITKSKQLSDKPNTDVVAAFNVPAITEPSNNFEASSEEIFSSTFIGKERSDDAKSIDNENASPDNVTVLSPSEANSELGIGSGESVRSTTGSATLLKANETAGLADANEKVDLQVRPFDLGAGAAATTATASISQSNILSSRKKVEPLTKQPAAWNMLFYVTPSISYRYLSEAKIVDLHQQNGPIAPNFTHGVNNFVRHKAIAGFELGAAFVHNITPSVRLRAGLQANVRGYSIEAYASKRQPSTIVLNQGFYTDSLVSISSISTQEGYRPLEITNRYFEIVVPVALDLRLANWKKVQVYVAAGLQPTYQFNKSMYMISNDYKNYVQDPNLVRHFNMNTSIEAFMSYKAGGVTWQVGPQIRYQMLPGAIDQYPVRERLIDYGFKIGVVKTLH